MSHANDLHMTMCMTAWPNACYEKILVFILEYNNNISCIAICFLHASVPSVSYVGQINWGRMGGGGGEGNGSKFNSLT